MERAMKKAIKRILEKIVGQNRKEWPHKLDEALWAFRTAFKTPLGSTLFRLVYVKACHLLVELEHKAYWALKSCNMDLTKAGGNRFCQINELDELRLNAYESSITYEERTKRWHDKRIKTPIKFVKRDKVILFNSHLRLFLGKLKSKWYEPFAVNRIMKGRAIELCDNEGNEFIVNRQRVKLYQLDITNSITEEDVILDDEGVTYGYIKNHKKTVKNGQARTRESEEYKKKPKNQSRSQEVKDRSQIQSTWSTAVNHYKTKPHNNPIPVLQLSQKAENDPSYLNGPFKKP
ncbi:reverse transcriptase domain-containing protein [Tanacetum coccineum]